MASSTHVTCRWGRVSTSNERLAKLRTWVLGHHCIQIPYIYSASHTECLFCKGKKPLCEVLGTGAPHHPLVEMCLMGVITVSIKIAFSFKLTENWRRLCERPEPAHETPQLRE